MLMYMNEDHKGIILSVITVDRKQKTKWECALDDLMVDSGNGKAVEYN